MLTRWRKATPYEQLKWFAFAGYGLLASSFAMLGALEMTAVVHSLEPIDWAFGILQFDDLTPMWAAALVPFAMSFVVFIAFSVPVRMSIWVLLQVRQQERMAIVQAELAVAEERLRFSRDLHDIFGRTLTAVVVKSELTAELVEVDQADQAAQQMREVNQLSNEALREVRGVVAGYREVNLDTELKGAQVVLGAAGAQTRIIGDAEAIAREHRAPLAWAVREAVTNVVRHSNAQHCTIDVANTPRPPC